MSIYNPYTKNDMRHESYRIIETNRVKALEALSSKLNDDQVRSPSEREDK